MNVRVTMTGGTQDGEAALAARRTATQTLTPTREDGRLPSGVRWLLASVAVALIVTMGFEQFEFTPSFPLTRQLMQTQDVPVLIGVAALLLIVAALGVPAAWARWAERLGSSAGSNSIVIPVVAAGAVVALGTHFVAFDFGLTRDEAMALFDAKILGSGRLLGPVPPEWRPYVPALQPEFRLAVPGEVAWISSYLPGNAAIRAFLGLALPSMLINSALALAALVAVSGIARQIWPERRDAWVVAVLLAASSSQVLFMSMTPYAMSAHLALNLIWLWLFLRNTAWSHVAAIGAGFVATGLHQIVFHPLFVAPFILQMLWDRRWKLALVYIASYGAIGVFWIVYWQLLLAGSGIAPEAASAMGSMYLASRVASLLANFSHYGIETMVQNLLRFAAWQNPMMLVLLVPGMALAWRADGVLRSLAGGIVLTLLAMFILLPYQDIGWGYRYVHGLIGNAALLGALGWIELTPASSGMQRRAMWGLLAVTTAVATVVLVPLHAMHMRAKIEPYARAHGAITQMDADAVVVDSISIYYGIDLVRNDPDLKNKPLTFDIGKLNDGLVRNLCSRFRVKVFTGQDAARFGMTQEDPRGHSDYAQLHALRMFIESPACAAMLRPR